MPHSSSAGLLDAPNTATRVPHLQGPAVRRSAALGLAAALALGAGEAAAQAPHWCPNAPPPSHIVPPEGKTEIQIVKEDFRGVVPLPVPPPPTEPVQCWFSDGDGDRYVVVLNPRITVTEDWTPGIDASHPGGGDLVVYVRSVVPNPPYDDPLHFHPLDHGNYAVRTSGSVENVEGYGDNYYSTGEDSYGVWADHRGEGRVGIDFHNLSLSTAGGDGAFGIYASQEGSYVWDEDTRTTRRARGAVIVNVIETERDREGRVRPLIGTRGDYSDAIRAEYTRAAAYGHVVVTVEGYTIATGGIVPKGPQVPNTGEDGGQLVPSLTGKVSRGIYAFHEGHGDIRVKATDSHILTWGHHAHGVFADHTGITETITLATPGNPTEVRTGGGAIDVDVTGGRIGTEGDGSIAIYGHHKGSIQGAGGIAIDAAEVAIATRGEESHGILAWIRPTLTGDDPVTGRREGDPVAGTGEGDVAISVTGGSIATEGAAAFAVWAKHENEGDVSVTVGGGAATTAGDDAHAVFAEHLGSSGDVSVTVGGGAVATKGDEAHGAWAKNTGGGALTVAVTGGSVTTEGLESHGVFALQNGDGNAVVRMTGGAIVAKGRGAHGIEAHGGGDVTVAIDGGSVAAQGDFGAGVVARSVATRESGKGAVTVSVGAGGTVSAASGFGIYSDGPRDLNVTVEGRVEGDVFHNGDGALILTLPEGGVVTGTVHDPQNRFTVRGSIGRLFYNTGGVVTIPRGGRLTGVEVELEGKMLTQAIRSIAGGLTVTVQGAVGGDVRGDGTGDGVTHRVTVEEGGTVAGTIRLAASTVDLDGTAGRVWLENGGTVTVGDTGRLTGVEGELDGETLTQAIRSDTGDLVASLAGRLTGDVLALGSGTHRVTVGEGGDVSGTVRVATEVVRAGTGSAVTIDGAAGRVRLDRGGALTVGPKGRIRGIDDIAVSHGQGSDIDIEVNQHPDETLVESLARVNGRFVADDGAASQVRARVRQADGRTVELQLLGTKGATPHVDGAYDVGIGVAKEGGVRLTRDIAPRARLYEALPSVLLGMNDLPEFQDRMAAPRDAKGGWARVEATGGDWKADASSSHEKAREESRVGLEYDHHRYGIQVGLDAPLGEDGLLGVSLHHRRGSAKVRDGGDIEPSGTGGGVSGTWSRNDVYVDVQAEATWYETDFSSATRGPLKDGVKGSGWALGMETGRRVASGVDGVVLIPRAGLVHSRVSLDDFEDAVGARMSLEEGRSLKGRLGLGVETKLNGSPENRLIGSLDVEHELKDETKVRVSGTELKATAKATWLRLGLDGVHSWGDGRYALQGGVSYTEGGGGNYEIGGELALKVRF